MADHEFKIFKTIRWEIPNFTRHFAKKQAIGKKIESEPVTLSYDDNVTTWSIQYYPNGDNDKSSGFFGLFLIHKASTTKHFNAKYNFGILKKSGEVSNKMDIERNGEDFVNGFGYGFSKYVSHDDLFSINSTLISDNKLIIQCKLSINAPKVAPYAVAQRSVRRETMFSDYEKLFVSGVFVDFSMVMNDGKTLKAHKTILIARSPVFFKMLTIDMKEAKKNSVEISDIDSKTMKELLRFVYCNKAENLDAVATSLIYAAEKYEIAELKKICLDHILSNLSKENVVDSLVVADHLSGTENLFDKCVSFIALHYCSVSTTAKWKKLQADLLRRVIKKVINQNGIVYVH